MRKQKFESANVVLLKRETQSNKWSIETITYVMEGSNEVARDARVCLRISDKDYLTQEVV